MVTLKQIEAVYWVYTLSSYRDAAEKLNTTQSALSKRVAELESTLDLGVFENKNRTQLTIAGRDLIKDFAEMLSLQQTIINKFRASKSYSGRFRMGVTEVVALNWLPRLIFSIKEDYPDIILESNVDKAKNLLRKLDSHLLDIIIVPYGANPGDSLVSDYLCSVDCEWMISKALVPEGAPLKLEEVFNYPLLMHSEDSVLYNELQKMLKRYRIKPKEKIYCGSIMAMAELTNNKLGLSYLPKTINASFGKKLENLRKIDIPMTIAPLKFYAVHRNDSLCFDVVNTIRHIFSGDEPNNHSPSMSPNS